MAVTDASCLLAAALAAHTLRFGAGPPGTEFLLVMALGAVILPSVFAAFGLYQVQHTALAEQFQRVVASVGLSVTILAVGAFWSKSPLSRLWLGLTWMLSTLLILGGRGMWHRTMDRMRERGSLAYRTVIVGANAEAAHLAGALRSAGTGFRVIGCVSTRRGGPRHERLAVLGSVAGLRQVIRRTGAECVFVASTAVTVEEMGAVSRAARLEEVEVRVSANLPGVASTRLTIRPVGELVALSLRPVRLTGSQRAAKRAFDLTTASLLVLLGLPLWAAIAAAIKLTSPGPVLYRQVRVGRGGREFAMFKFRTMVRGADGLATQLQHLNGARGSHFKIRQDPRVTPVGRWLRRWSLDELPQLLNVLRGEMSLVGPRPAVPREVALYGEEERNRLEATPGITGLWQVSGRADLPFDECVRLDAFYIQNWSLLLDLYILARTVPAVLTGRGAY